MDFTIDTAATTYLQQDSPCSFATPHLPQGSLSSAALARFVAAHQRKTEALSTLFDDHLHSVRRWIGEVTAVDQQIAHDVAAVAADQREALPPNAQPRAVDRSARHPTKGWQTSAAWGAQP